MNTKQVRIAMSDAVVQPEVITQRRLHLGHPDHHVPGYELPENASPPPTRKACVVGFGVAVMVAIGGWLLHRLGDTAVIPNVSLPWAFPFAGLLACIAILPFAAKHFWEKYYQYVSIALGTLVVAYYLFGVGAPRVMAEVFGDYVSFIFLLGSLFVVSGGVIIRVHRKASPGANVMLLIIGSILANVFGTTGASMLLIRPFLRLNKGRVRPYHIVFFIFCVSNVGGALTPIGDPPLFLGYLRGVPFWWVLRHCWPIWLTAIGCLAAAFSVIDTIHCRREKRELVKGEAEKESEAGKGGGLREIVSIFGTANVFFIGMILAGVFLDSPLREILMAAAAFGSLATTSHRIYGENHFNYTPIKEVALLFVGIFATMAPAMNYLHTQANDDAFKRYLHTPGNFYFASGALSSVLDNAPTYVTFLEMSLGRLSSQQAALHHIVNRYHGEELAAGTLDPSVAELGYLQDDSGKLTDGESRDVQVFDCDLNGGGFLWSMHIHWKRAEFHGEVDRGSCGCEDAIVLFVHSVLHPAGAFADFGFVLVSVSQRMKDASGGRFIGEIHSEGAMRTDWK